MVQQADDVRTRAELLDGTRWANEFKWAEIEGIATYLSIRHAARGVVVCKEGEIDPSLFIIAKGSVNVVKQDHAAHDKPLAELGPGQTIGEMALVDRQPRSATAVAAQDLVLLVLDRKALDAMIEEQPRLAVKLALKLARLLSQRLRRTSGELADRLDSA